MLVDTKKLLFLILILSQGLLVDFLLLRKDSKTVILTVFKQGKYIPLTEVSVQCSVFVI